MDIEFEILVSDTLIKRTSEDHSSYVPHYVSEKELFENLETYSDYLSPTKQTHYGQLVLTEKGQPTITFPDEMQNICMQFCFLTLKTLVTDKRATFHIMMTGKPIELEEIDGNIRIKIGETEAIYDKASFIKTACNCGHRYLELIDLLPSEGHQASKRVIEQYTHPVALLLKEQGFIE